MIGCLVSVVTWNSAPCLEACLLSVSQQTFPVTLRVFDNASRDGSASIARRFAGKVKESSRNVGFCRGHNANLEGCEFDYALLLNPDTRLAADFVERLVDGLSRYERAGMAGGRLLRMDPAGRELRHDGLPVLDSTGMYFTPSLRHFDRGSGEPDRGRYQNPEAVFGITGAALLCSRRFIREVSLGGEFLDEDFFAYREDADLAWRAQLLGWQAVYLPEATAWHARNVLPERRKQASAAANYHSVKNRFLMRLKNLDPQVRRRCFPYSQWRDLGILAYLALRERSSIPALGEVRRLRPRMMEKRQLIQEARRISGDEMASWFSFQPVSRPL